MGLMKLAYEATLKIAKPLSLDNKVEEVGLHLSLLRARLFGYGQIPDRPREIFIEPTNVCDLNCIMCPRTRIQQRGKGFMTFELFMKIIDEIADWGVQRVVLQMGGEPLLHPRFRDMIIYSKGKGLEVSFNTNANSLTEEKSRAILKSDLDRIVFSVDGASSAAYEKVRRGGNDDKLCRNIRKFTQLKEEGKFSKLETVLQTIIMNGTEEDTKKIIQIWSPIVDKVAITAVTESADVRGVSLVNINPDSKKVPCLMLWKTLAVLWNGDVTVCCTDIIGDLVVGNILKESLQSLWKGSKLSQIRNVHLKGEFEKLPKCRNCEVINIDAIKKKKDLISRVAPTTNDKYVKEEI